MMVRDGVIGIVLQRGLQTLDRLLGVSLGNFDLPAVNQSFDVVGRVFQNFIIEFAGFIQAVLEDEQLNVVLLHLQVFRMVVVKRTVLGNGVVEIAGREIKVAEHAVADWVIGKILFRLLQKCFRFRFLSLGQQKASHGGAGFRILGIDVHGVAKLLFRFRESAARLVIGAQSQLRPHLLRIYLHGLLEVQLGGVGLIATHLQKSQREV